MNIFKRLWAFLCFEVKGLFSDILSGNLTDTEKDNLFWLFVTLWGLVMVTFFILHESTGAVFEL
jgi:sugar phosphate permease